MSCAHDGPVTINWYVVIQEMQGRAPEYFLQAILTCRTCSTVFEPIVGETVQPARDVHGPLIPIRPTGKRQ